MLTSISCDLFRVGNRPRPPIQFHMGLNTILGSVTGEAGSIGKSSMMLIIDFVFGGNSYLSSDAVRELDPHAICFTFTFSGADYHFARRTNDAKRVTVVDADRNILAVWDITVFTSWLAERYGMDLPGASFRNMLSRYFRIYGKNNHNEAKPLQTRGGDEGQRDAIGVLIALFEFYAKIEAFKSQLQQAEDRISAFRAARKYKFIPSAVDGMTKYQENVAEIADLEQQRRRLQRSDDTTVDHHAIVESANQRNALKQILNDARRSVTSAKNELHLLELNLEHGAYPTDADLAALQEFFPEADLKRLVEVEAFHSKIQTILARELETAKAQVEDRIRQFQELQDEAIASMDAIPVTRVFDEEFLEAYSALDRRISKLTDENEAFDTRNRLQVEKKGANDRYQQQVASVLARIETAVNSRMDVINEEVTGGEYNAPHLTLRAYNSYSFETPRDKGTGTGHRGMAIYDLAVLHNTALPAIGHDSVMFDSMTKPDISNLIHVYADQIEKQVFISIDKTSNCTPEAKRIVAETTVLKLDNNDHALFGAKWSKKEQT